MGNARCLERLAHAALYHPAVAEVVNAVGARAEFAAEAFVIIPAGAEGDIQLSQGELVLQVERLLIDLYLRTEVVAVAEFGAAQFAAQGQQVVAEERGHLAVDRMVGLVDVAEAAAAQVGHDLGVVHQIDVFVVVADSRVKAVPAAVVGQTEGAAFHLLNVGRKGEARVAPGALAVVLTMAQVEVDALALV